MDVRVVPTGRPTIGYPATADQIFQLILSSQANSRCEIGRLTGLSRTAITARISQLPRELP
jgi:biotin operon repressor